MSTRYSYEQATGLLTDLAANEEVRRQLLADPEATFRKYGFEIDPAQVPASRELAGSAQLEESSRNNHRRKEERELPALYVFMLK